MITRAILWVLSLAFGVAGLGCLAVGVLERLVVCDWDVPMLVAATLLSVLATALGCVAVALREE